MFLLPLESLLPLEYMRPICFSQCRWSWNVVQGWRFLKHYMDVTNIALTHLRSPANRLFVKQLLHIKENVKLQSSASVALRECPWNAPVSPAQRASNADSVSMSWRHHKIRYFCCDCIIFFILSGFLQGINDYYDRTSEAISGPKGYDYWQGERPLLNSTDYGTFDQGSEARRIIQDHNADDVSHTETSCYSVKN